MNKENNEKKYWHLFAEGVATFDCWVQAETKEEARELFKKGDYESDQIESWIEEIDNYSTLECED
jgi:hypothetical protein